MKKILSVFLIILLSNFIASSETVNVEIDNLRYNIDITTGEATLSGIVSPSIQIENLVIPDAIKYQDSEYPVTVIGEWAFSDCSGFTGSLTIGNYVTTIGEYAFRGCSGFTGSLTIPNSVTTIDECAFSDCSGFTGSLTIPNSVTVIGNNAFSGCRGFTGSLTIGNSVITIGDAAFIDCSGFTGSLTIPNSVTVIGNNAFRECSGFTGSLTIGNSVTTIGEIAFYHCYGFTGSLTIPNSVTTIGAYAFYMCSGFRDTLILPGSLTSIGIRAFYSFSYPHFSVVKYLTDNPIESTNDVFSFYLQKTLYVLSDGLEKAKTTQPWSSFYNIEPIISFNQSDATLTVSQTLQLKVTYYSEKVSEKELSWQSSDETVATVNENGLVKAVSVGEATITATTKDELGLTVSCIVTVTPRLAESITLDHENVSLNTGETVQLRATILPYNTTDKAVRWLSSDPEIASVDESGLVKAVKGGDAVITAVTTDGSDLSASCHINVLDYSGIEYVYNDKFTIRFIDGTIVIDGLEDGVDTALISLNGRILEMQKSSDAPIVYHSVEPGIYIVRIGNRSYKIIAGC